MGSNYFEVWVSSPQYHSDSALTYSYDAALLPGNVVNVPLKRQTVLAVVVRKVKKPSFSTKQIIDVVANRPLPPQQLKLIDWLKGYYPAPSGQIVSLFLPSLLASKSKSAISMMEDKSKTKDTRSLPELTNEQTKTLVKIRRKSPKSVLLHGDTGTGKTRIYLELAKDNASKNLSTIILTPEIGLTAQLASAFHKFFPGRTIVLHSELTPAERRNRWHEVLNANNPLVIIGPRSALFSPVAKLGLVVIDEFHETAYKQEQAPYYLATRVGAKLAAIHQAQLILGSATPPVTDYYVFETKNLPVIRMQEQAITQKPTDLGVQVIDLKDKKHFAISPWVSSQMIEAINQTIGNHQQALVFLNRRGTARLVLCQSCGWQALCSKCDLPLTYHADAHIMLCHTCGFRAKTPSTCSDCGANNIIFRSIGTKSVVTEMHRLFPDARVKRFDSDSAKADRLESQYHSIREGNVDILVGTQMIGKGLDLPKLAVVGIITAETSLSFPDYTAEERTYQLISQAMGRINRGHVPGTAIVQTYQPDSLVLKSALSKDYYAFYRQQIEERKTYGFPPFRFVLKLSCARSSSDSARQASMKLSSKLQESDLPIEIIGPSPSFTERTHDKYHWQIIVKSVRRQALVDVIKQLPANWTYNIDPINLL